MAIHSSKLSVQDIYSIVADKLGLTIADGVEVPVMPAPQFLRSLNLCLSEIGSITDSVERLVILLFDKRWLRYTKITPEEANNGMVRIDLEGQKPTLLSATDPDNLDWQYEDPCSGDGTDPDYAQTGDATATPPYATAPDSFPKIYLPAECDIPLGTYTVGIPLASYGYIIEDAVTNDIIYYEPMGHQNRIGGSNEPLTPFVVDMRKVGYGSFTIGNDNYPTATDTSRYFIDPFLIYGMRCIIYMGGTTDSVIPHSADAYLNDTWATILNMPAGVDTAQALAEPAPPGQTFFIMDGITYEVTITEAGFDATINDPFTFRITDTVGGGTWDYTIYPDDTPWVTVGTQATRWTSLMAGSSLYSNRAWYVKVNDLVLRLPDDLRRIKWMWKIPTNTMYLDIPEDADEDTVATAVADVESYNYSRLDEAYHYFPITETRFTQLKYLETQGYDFRGAGFYLQSSQQLRILPRPIDLKSAVIALMYEAKPDNVPTDTVIADFATTFMEVPNEAVNVIIYMILAGYHASGRSKDFDAAGYYEGKAARALHQLRSLYGGRQGQQADAPIINQTLDGQQALSYFGFKRLR